MGTLWIEILVIAAIVIFFGALIGTYIYKKVHHIPTGECSHCLTKKKALVKEYHKIYGKK